MKKTVSLLLALALCLGLSVPTMAAGGRTIRAMTDEESLRYLDFGPNTPIDDPQDVYVEEELRLDMGSSGRMTESGYFAIRKDAVFTLGNRGTPGSGSFLVMYMAPFERRNDGIYHMASQYYLRGGSQSGWAANNPNRADEIKVTSGNIISVGIPTEYLPEDTLYQFIIMAYLNGNWVQLFALLPESGSSGTASDLAGIMSGIIGSMSGSTGSSGAAGTTATVTRNGYTYTALPADGIVDCFWQGIAQIRTRVRTFRKDGNGGYRLYLEYMP